MKFIPSFLSKNKSDASRSNGVITFFDVETPNRHNDRICSIGVTQTDMRGRIVNKASHLVNPEAGFDDVCMRVHGITAADVRNSPTFPELWDVSLRSVFADTLLVAHNAAFDLSVIWKDLDNYGLEIPKLEYACTLTMMKQRHPGLSSYKLQDVCAYYGLSMGRHHDSFADAAACRDIFWAMVEEADELPAFASYEYAGSTHEVMHSAFHRVSAKTTALQIVKSIAEKAVEDDVISLDEASKLYCMLKILPEASEDKTIRPIFSMLERAIADGEVDQSESLEIGRVLKHFIDPVASDGDEGDIEFVGKNFVLTGNFEHGTKDSVASMIESRGGVLLKSVTKKCDYVVVGGFGNESWSMGNYGSKVKKALDWQAKGVPVRIVSEQELFDAL